MLFPYPLWVPVLFYLMVRCLIPFFITSLLHYFGRNLIIEYIVKSIEYRVIELLSYWVIEWLSDCVLWSIHSSWKWGSTLGTSNRGHTMSTASLRIRSMHDHDKRPPLGSIGPTSCSKVARSTDHHWVQLPLVLCGMTYIRLIGLL